MPKISPDRKRWRWLRREAIDLGDVVVQIFAVVVGILLALLINDWVTQRSSKPMSMKPRARYTPNWPRTGRPCTRAPRH